MGLIVALGTTFFIGSIPAFASGDMRPDNGLSRQIDLYLSSAEADATSSSLAVRVHAMAEASNLGCTNIRAALWKSSAQANSAAADALRLVRDLYASCDDTAAGGLLGTGAVPLTGAPGFAVGAGSANYQ